MGVEKGALVVGIDEGAAFVLTVDVDQASAKGLEHGHRHRQSVRLRRASSLGRNTAGEDQLVVVERAAEQGFDIGPEQRIRDVEHRRRARLGLSLADEIGRRLASQHQAQGGQQQTFSRPGLARPGAIPRLKIDSRVLDQREVLHR